MSTGEVSPAATGAKHIVALDRQRHAGLGVDSECSKRYAQHLNSIFLNVIEFFYAIRHYPVAFAKDSAGNYLPCAVTGLVEGENLFVDSDGAWESGLYIPSQVRMYPVYVSAEGTTGTSGEDQRIILVDESALIESDEPFFTRSAQPTDKWQQIERFVADYISAEKQTRKFAARLAQLGLFEAFDAQINPAQSSPMRLTGLFRVNEDRLNDLPPDDIKALMKGGELSRIYAHLISLENFASLLDRAAKKQSQK